ncbi:hypothetical protein ACFVFQ_31780 [Streptomyces sp. NPDC057743]
MNETFEKEAAAALDALSEQHMEEARQAAAAAEEAERQAAALRGAGR